MKVRKLLELQANIEERKIPCDLCDDELNQHYSLSKDKAIDILDMDLIHLIRSYSKSLQQQQDVKQTGARLSYIIKFYWIDLYQTANLTTNE